MNWYFISLPIHYTRWIFYQRWSTSSLQNTVRTTFNEQTLWKLEQGIECFLKAFIIKERKKKSREFDYNAYLSSKGVTGILKIVDSTFIRIMSAENNFFKNTLHQIRKAIDEQLIKYHNLETFSLLRGLLLADRGE